MLKDILRLIRPNQWSKNLFVFLPLFFGGAIADGAAIIQALIGFIAFSFAASAIYCLNDVVDVEADRAHARKRTRPVASGAVSPRAALVTMAVMLVLSAGAALLFSDRADTAHVLAVLGTYVALNVAYCLRLKQRAVVDVFIVASGFVLRLLVGGYAGDVRLSRWIIIMTYLLSLFIALAKRRDDVLAMNETGVIPRANTPRYNMDFINCALAVTISTTLFCYIMYTISPEVTAQFGTDRLYPTAVFVLAGFMRYLQLAFVDKKTGDPTAILLRDRVIQAVLALWILTFVLIIYVL